MSLKKIILLSVAVSSLVFPQLDAAYVLQNGRLVHVDDFATLTVEEHYQLGEKAFEAGNWKEAASQFRIVANSFPQTTHGQEANFYLGISLFNLREFDTANQAFSNYLKSQSQPTKFIKAVEYKYSIAEEFRNVAKRRIMGSKRFPKWLSGKNLALEIYDEVLFAAPSSELAASALYSKASLLWEMRDYREAIDSFQLLTKRFPKNELAPLSYVLINKVYLDQSQYEFQNPDLLALAQINTRRFKQDFPKDERIVEAENDLKEIKESYAKGLFETASFYERTGQNSAAIIYYSKAAVLFPDTRIARRSLGRLANLNQEKFNEMRVVVENKLKKMKEDQTEENKNNIEDLTFITENEEEQ